MTRRLRWSLYWIFGVHAPAALFVAWRWPGFWPLLGVNATCAAVKIFIIEPLATPKRSGGDGV